MEEEIDIMDLIKFFWNKKILFIILWGITLLFSIIYTYIIIVPQYEASTSLVLLKTEFEDEGDVTAYSKLVDRYCVIASSRNVTNKVIDNLKLNINVENLQKKVTILGDSNSYSIVVNVKDEKKEDAARIANEIANVFIEKVKDEFNDTDIKVLDYAVANEKPVNVNLIENMVKYLIIVSVLLFGYVFICYIIRKNQEKK